MLRSASVPSVVGSVKLDGASVISAFMRPNHGIHEAGLEWETTSRL